MTHSLNETKPSEFGLALQYIWLTIQESAWSYVHECIHLAPRLISWLHKCVQYSGPWFSMRMLSYQYRKYHCVDQTILSSSYLYNGISYTGKKTSLNWIRTQFFVILTRPCRSQYNAKLHYSDVIMSAMAYQITSLTIVYSTVYSDADHRRRRKHQSSEWLIFVREIHRWPVNSPHKGPVTRKYFHLMMSSWHQIKFIYSYLAMMTTVGATSTSPFFRIDTLFAYWSVHQLESSASRCALWVHYQHYTTQ